MMEKFGKLKKEVPHFFCIYMRIDMIRKQAEIRYLMISLKETNKNKLETPIF